MELTKEQTTALATVADLDLTEEQTAALKRTADREIAREDFANASRVLPRQQRKYGKDNPKQQAILAAFEKLKTRCLSLWEGMEAACKKWELELREVSIKQRQATTSGELAGGVYKAWQKDLFARSRELQRRMKTAREEMNPAHIQITRFIPGMQHDAIASCTDESVDLTLGSLLRIRELLALDPFKAEVRKKVEAGQGPIPSQPLTYHEIEED